MCQTFGCCRGGSTFACFECRTTAKAWDSHVNGCRSNFPDPKRTNKTERPRCPRCRQPMTDLGKRVEVPRRSATRKWRQLAERFGAPRSLSN